MNPYEILGVGRDATEDEIKKAYRNQSMKTHPDLNNGETEAFKQVERAYRILTTPEKRERYDRFGNTDDESDPVDEAIRALIRRAFTASDYPLNYIKKELKVQKDKLSTKQNDLIRNKEKIQKRRNSFIKKNGKVDFVLDEIDFVIAQLEKDINNVDQGMNQISKYLDLLLEFKEEEKKETTNPAWNDFYQKINELESFKARYYPES